jgi:hypothetical protein
MTLPLQGLGLRALKTITLAALLFGSVNAAYAIIYVTVTYDTETNKTIVVTSGSWDSFTKTGSVGYEGFSGIGPDHFYAVDSDEDTWIANNQGLTLSSGSALPAAGSFSFNYEDRGDRWGFTSALLYAPVNYVSGDQINTEHYFNGDAFGILSNPNQGGTYTGGANTLIWSTVPEPATTVALSGFAVLLFCLWRRKFRKA